MSFLHKLLFSYEHAELEAYKKLCATNEAIIKEGRKDNMRLAEECNNKDKEIFNINCECGIIRAVSMTQAKQIISLNDEIVLLKKKKPSKRKRK